MLDAALAAAQQIFTRPFRAVLWKSSGLTLALLALVWAGLHKLIVAGAALPYPWAATVLSLVSGAGLFIGLALLIAPISFIVAGFFFDELAEAVERELYPGEAPGRALPLSDAIWLSLKFSAVSLAINLLALLLLLVPMVNAAAACGANAYLYGRGYFELAAARHLPLSDVHWLRRANQPRLIAAGAVMSSVLAVPFLNLLTPLFSTAFMVRIACPIIRSSRKGRRPPQD